jgi:muconate cycloisomerase
MNINRIEMTPVVVPARENAINSPGKAAPLHMLSVGASKGWSVQFDSLIKWILRIHTDEGVTGIGESLRAVNEASMREIAESLIGTDPTEMNLRDLPIPYGRAYDGFECAIYDLVGKVLSVPAYTLLGGAYRERVYCSAWFGQRDPEDAGRCASEFREMGYDCLKFKGSLDEDPVAVCKAIKDQAGKDFRVIIDPNTRWERPAEILPFLGRLEEIGNVWILEDPIPRWDLRNWRHLRRKSSIPLALHTAIPYAELFQKPQDVILAIQEEAVDYFNFNGPMAWVQKLGDIAEVANMPFWHGSEVDLGLLEASYLHVAAASKLCTLPSDIFGRLIREHDLLAEPLSFDGKGNFMVPTGPGLGVELDEKAVTRYAGGETVTVSADS